MKEKKKYKRINGTGEIIHKKDNRKKPYLAVITEGYVIGDDGIKRAKKRQIGAFTTRSQAELCLNNFFAGKAPSEIDTFYDLYVASMNYQNKSTKRKSGIDAFKQYISSIKVFESLYDEKLNYLSIYKINEVWVKANKNAPTNKKIRSMFKIMFSYSWYKSLTDNYSLSCELYDNINFNDKKGDKEKMHHSFTEEEVKILLADDEHSLIRDIFKVMIYTGLRINELITLRVDDVYITNDKREIVLKEENTKTKQSRRIPIHKEIGRIINEYRNNSKSGFVFENVKQQKFSYSNFRDCYWDKWMYMHGYYSDDIKHLPHDTRYTFKTFSFHSGCNPEYVEAILGHNENGSMEKLYKDLDRTAQYAMYFDIQKLKFTSPKHEIDSLAEFLKNK